MRLCNSEPWEGIRQFELVMKQISLQVELRIVSHTEFPRVSSAATVRSLHICIYSPDCVSKILKGCTFIMTVACDGGPWISDGNLCKVIIAELLKITLYIVYRII